MEVKAQLVIDNLVEQNKRLVAEIAVLRAVLGLDGEQNEEEQQEE